MKGAINMFGRAFRPGFGGFRPGFGGFRPGFGGFRPGFGAGRFLLPFTLGAATAAAFGPRYYPYPYYPYPYYPYPYYY
jgi:hypothetical protein